jgi:hypothetical protein
MASSPEARWSQEDLLEARFLGQFSADDRLGEPDLNCAVTAPFPGCMQLSGQPDQWQHARPVAQTAQFVIFALNTPNQLA